MGAQAGSLIPSTSLWQTQEAVQALSRPLTPCPGIQNASPNLTLLPFSTFISPAVDCVPLRAVMCYKISYIEPSLSEGCS